MSLVIREGALFLAYWSIIALRAVGVSWFVFTLVQRRRARALNSRVVCPKGPSQGDIWHDIRLNVQSSAVFAIMTVGLQRSVETGNVRLYGGPLHGWYPVVSFLALFLIHDCFAYFSHRLFHLHWMYRFAHAGHHGARHTNPFGALAMGPLESLSHGVFLTVFVHTVPIHFVVFGLYLVMMSLWTLWTHLGIELFGDWFPRFPGTSLLVGTSYHEVHHQLLWQNFGLYTSVWDRLFRSYYPGYPKVFGKPMVPDVLKEAPSTS